MRPGEWESTRAGDDDSEATPPTPRSGPPASPDPISADAPAAIHRPLLTQSWLDLTFLH